MSIILEVEGLINRIIGLYGDVRRLRFRRRMIVRMMKAGGLNYAEKYANTDLAILHKRALIGELMHQLKQVMYSEGYATECRLKRGVI